MHLTAAPPHEDKIQKAFESLTDAQVAVYPVDARGLEAPQVFTATQNPVINRRDPGGSLARQQSREESRRFAAQSTMEEIAEETGGTTCKNTNDLAGCVQTALDDSSVYYELAYYPENVRWDNKFHKITVKSNQHGIKLRYRTGYFATDAATLAKRRAPAVLLQQACSGPLPSTSIPLTVMPLQPTQAPGQAPEPRYLLTVSPGALTRPVIDASRALHLQMAICEFGPKGDSYDFFPRDLSRDVPDALFADWQTNGMRDIFDYAAKPESQRLRFAVLDVQSGATGSVDVPAHVQLPVPAPAPAAAPLPVRIPFKSSSGKTSALDWSTGSLMYRGDIAADQGALAFFNAAYGTKFRCDAGKLVPKDASSSASPGLLLTFRAPDGHGALVEMSGEAPVYSGDMTIDPSARAFFDIVWKLTHCQQP